MAAASSSAEGGAATGGEGDDEAGAPLQGCRFTEGHLGDLRNLSPRGKEEGSEPLPARAERGKAVRLTAGPKK
jgi:hypothetical protein